MCNLMNSKLFEEPCLFSLFCKALFKKYLHTPEIKGL